MSRRKWNLCFQADLRNQLKPLSLRTASVSALSSPEKTMLFLLDGTLVLMCVAVAGLVTNKSKFCVYVCVAILWHFRFKFSGHPPRKKIRLQMSVNKGSGVRSQLWMQIAIEYMCHWPLFATACSNNYPTSSHTFFRVASGLSLIYVDLTLHILQKLLIIRNLCWLIPWMIVQILSFDKIPVAHPLYFSEWHTTLRWNIALWRHFRSVMTDLMNSSSLGVVLVAGCPY